MTDRSLLVSERVWLPTAQKVHVVIHGRALHHLAGLLMRWERLTDGLRTHKRVFLEKFNRLVPLVAVNRGRSAAPRSAFFSSLDTGFGSLADQRAFKMRQGGHDVKKQFAHGRSGINAFSQAFKLNAAFLEAGRHFHQFGQAATEPVQLPYYKNVTPSQVLERLFKLRPFMCRAAHMLHENLGVWYFSLAQRIKLQIKVLIIRGNAGIAHQIPLNLIVSHVLTTPLSLTYSVFWRIRNIGFLGSCQGLLAENGAEK